MYINVVRARILRCLFIRPISLFIVDNLVGYEDLLSFYLLSKSHDTLQNKSKEEFEIMSKEYLKGIKKESIPKDFLKNNSNTDTDANATIMNDETNPSKLISLLGNYTPPQTCDIPNKMNQNKQIILNLYKPQQNQILQPIRNVDQLHSKNKRSKQANPRARPKT